MKRLLALALAVLLPCGLGAQATALVWEEDAAYRDLDVLRSVGLVSGVLFSQRPWAHATFTRALAEARTRIGPDAPERVREALERLEARFAADPEGESAAALRDALLSLTKADSPGREVPILYASPDPEYPPMGDIDALVNPLLDGRRGRVYSTDGVTAALEAAAEVRLGTGLAAYVRPRVWRAGRDGEVDATLQAAYVRALLGNLAVEVGRVPSSPGHGRLGGPALSRNVRALDMVRLSPEQPFRLPWILRAVGPFQPSILLADMGGARDHPHSKLVVMRLAAKPTRTLEVGATLLNHQGGEGSPPASFWERLQDVFLWGVPGFDQLYFSDKAAGVDARLTVPDAGLEIWVDGITTDVNMFRFHEVLWDEAAWVAGMRLSGLGAEGRTDVWLEGQRSGVRPYTHYQYTDGLTVERRVMGLGVGPMATAWAAGLDWNGAETRVSVEGAWERYRGDQYHWNGLDAGDWRWERVSDEPDEIRLRAVVGLERRSVNSGLRALLRLGAERVTRWAWTEGDRTNWVAEVVVGWEG